MNEAYMLERLRRRDADARLAVLSRLAPKEIEALETLQTLYAKAIATGVVLVKDRGKIYRETSDDTLHPEEFTLHTDMVDDRVFVRQLVETLAPYKEHLELEPESDSVDFFAKDVVEVDRDGKEICHSKSILFDTRKGIPIPVEPIGSICENSVYGRFYATGIVRIADLETVKLLWAFMDLVERDGERSALNLSEQDDFVSAVVCGKVLLREFPQFVESHSAALEKARRLLCNLPQSPETSGGLAAAAADLGLQISKVAFEPCNRSCSFCSMLATKTLCSMSKERFDQWLSNFSPGREVAITYGEPFLSEILSYAVERILRSRAVEKLAIVTSGINFLSELERGNAEAIVALPLSFRERICLQISVSDGPHYDIPGLSQVEAARKVQRDTLKWAIKNNISFYFISFLKPAQLFEELVLPVLCEIIPDLDTNGLVSDRYRLFQYRTPVPIGRQALVDGRAISYDEKRNLDLDPSCVLNEGANQIAITADGTVLPACCRPESAYVGIANLDEGNLEELKGKTRMFVAALRALNAEKSALSISETVTVSSDGTQRTRSFSTVPGSGLTCLDCIALARTLRDPERCKKAIGPANFLKVETLRVGLRK